MEEERGEEEEEEQGGGRREEDDSCKCSGSCPPPSLPEGLRPHTEARTALKIAMATAFLPGSMAVVMMEGWRDGGRAKALRTLQVVSLRLYTLQPLEMFPSGQPEVAVLMWLLPFGIMGCSGPGSDVQIPPT